jgi:hypothetical protein
MPLQQVVDRYRRFLKILHDVGNALANRLRHVVDIGLRHRAHDRMIGGEIRLEDRSIDRLAGVVDGVGIGCGRRAT